MVIFERLRQERERLGLLQKDVAALVGMTPRAQNMYESGQRKPDSEYLATLAKYGFDVLYILTGQHQELSAPTSGAQDELLARGIAWAAGQAQSEVWISTKGLTWLLNFYEQRTTKFNLEWSLDLMNKVATHPTKDLRALHLQAVNLQGNSTRSYPQLLIYLARTPPYTPWTINPSEGLKDRYELDAGAHNLPLVFPETSYLTPVLVLSNDELAKLKDGKTVTVKP